MADFSVKVQKIFIYPHDNADALEIGRIGHEEGHQVVVKKGLYKTGDLVAYIGENSVVPYWLLQMHNYWDSEREIGTLAGPKGDRVKAIKLRGVYSLGICIPVKFFMSTITERANYHYIVNNEERIEFDFSSNWTRVEEGDDVTKVLGVTKYEPPIPVHMSGEVFNAGISVPYDIENIENYPSVIEDGEQVVMTEKLHGTWCCVGWFPELGNNPDCHGWFVSSKGMAKQGLAFKFNEANKHNVYLLATQKIREYVEGLIPGPQSAFVMIGEVIGPGIQDLNYGVKHPTFRLFDVLMINETGRRYLDLADLESFAHDYQIPLVPNLHRGPFSMKIAKEICNGKTTMDNATHIREGVVIKPIKERVDSLLGRVQLKLVSQAYRLRKGNVTEYN